VPFSRGEEQQLQQQQQQQQQQQRQQRPPAPCSAGALGVVPLHSCFFSPDRTAVAARRGRERGSARGRVRSGGRGERCERAAAGERRRKRGRKRRRRRGASDGDGDGLFAARLLASSLFPVARCDTAAAAFLFFSLFGDETAAADGADADPRSSRNRGRGRQRPSPGRLCLCRRRRIFLPQRRREQPREAAPLWPANDCGVCARPSRRRRERKRQRDACALSAGSLGESRSAAAAAAVGTVRLAVGGVAGLVFFLFFPDAAAEAAAP